MLSNYLAKRLGKIARLGATKNFPLIGVRQRGRYAVAPRVDEIGDAVASGTLQSVRLARLCRFRVATADPSLQVRKRSARGFAQVLSAALLERHKGGRRFSGQGAPGGRCDFGRQLQPTGGLVDFGALTEGGRALALIDVEEDISGYQIPLSAAAQSRSIPTTGTTSR
jgi:hypothetical protein